MYCCWGRGKRAYRIELFREKFCGSKKVLQLSEKLKRGEEDRD